MKIIPGILLLLPAVLFYNCNSNNESNRPVTPPKNDSIKSKYMSQDTRLTAPEIFNVYIKIPSALCKKCEDDITIAVKKLPDIISVKADSRTKVASVQFYAGRITEETIRQAISKAGYHADNLRRDLDAYKKLDGCCKE